MCSSSIGSGCSRHGAQSMSTAGVQAECLCLGTGGVQGRGRQGRRKPWDELTGVAWLQTTSY